MALMTSTRRARAIELGTFVGLVLLLVVPIWSVAFVPTIDGPVHVYNAWVHRHLGSSGHSLLSQYYEVDWRPLPNWFSHACLALLMLVLEPRYAEKALLTGLVVLFAASVRYLATSVARDRGWCAVVALPLLYNQLLLLGFYNFSFGLAFYALVVGYWWRRPERFSLRFHGGLAALLLLCWFSHIVAFVAALFSAGVLSTWAAIARRRFKRETVYLTLLLPYLALPLWFVQAQSGDRIPSTWSVGYACRYLFRFEVLALFGPQQKWLGLGLSAMVVTLLIVRVVARVRSRTFDEADGFAILSVLFMVLFFVAPEGMSGGTLLKNRLSLFPLLALLPWLAPALGRSVRGALLVGVVILMSFQVGLIAFWYHQMQPDIRSFLASTAAIPRSSRVLPLLFSRDTTRPRFGALGHAIDYAAMDKGLVEWDNYQAATGYFPIRFRRDVERPEIYTMEAHPDKVGVGAYRQWADCVFTWKLPPDSALVEKLLRFYQPVAGEESGADGQVYLRRPDEKSL